ncbi:pleckstrin homology domain-containing family A member 5 isoform X20 [Cricetulus griseus]|uniref:Pleckstrin homology domain-containing family A member 5 isoform X20 n=1 Tax=Cricetulus griseus TaxID=10029 RepID=A0A9J7H746_CRIGR|nr:pleckstrin homology domain-containing family A member 5 isoform X20 [Cricetulus griseus]
MAADLNLEWICSLPRSWTYGITRGGRVFFINEEAKSTTWLHPVTGEAVVTGHRRQSTDLPTGWEEAYTFEGARYYINEALYYRHKKSKWGLERWLSLRALTALPEDLGSIPSTHMAAHNCNSSSRASETFTPMHIK